MDLLRKNRKDERIDVRLHKRAKELITRAAALRHQSVSDFVVSVLLERSRDVIERASVLELGEREASRFLEALASPPSPNAKLREATQRHRKAEEDGTLQTS